MFHVVLFFLVYDYNKDYKLNVYLVIFLIIHGYVYFIIWINWDEPHLRFGLRLRNEEDKKYITRLLLRNVTYLRFKDKIEKIMKFLFIRIQYTSKLMSSRRYHSIFLSQYSSLLPFPPSIHPCLRLGAGAVLEYDSLSNFYLYLLESITIKYYLLFPVPFLPDSPAWLTGWIV